MSDTTISVRIGENIKKQLEQLCSETGMNISIAFNIFTRAFIREQKLPFEVSSNALKNKLSGQQAVIKNFINTINAAEEPLNEDFDEIINNRFNITRELEI